MTKYTVTASVVDFCYSDFLTDHHNRDGERLVGISPHGQTRDDIADDIISNLQGACFPEAISDDAIRAAVIAACRPNVRIWPVDENGNDITDMEREDIPEEQPYLWVLLEWEVA